MTKQTKLYEKLQLEYQDFLTELREKPPEQIIEAAYEITAKQCILELFDSQEYISAEQANEMLANDYSLNKLYDVWMMSDGHIGEAIINCIDDYILEIPENELILPGNEVEGDTVHGYTVKQAVLFEDNGGIAFAHNPDAASPYVTWRVFHDSESGKLDYEWGKYFSSEEPALADFISRYEDYTNGKNLTEIPIPPPTRFATEAPYADHTIIVDITDKTLGAAKETQPEEIDRTYKAELKLPDQKDLHFEVFTAVDDVAAVKYAYELCMDWDDVQLMEVHELDDNYDIIREIDLKNHDPSLRRFMDVDLFDFLGHISDKVLIHYRNDWNIDKEFLLKRAESSDPNDKRVAWHVCATSSHQLDERDVFIKESGAFGYWTDYHQNDPDMFGFFVEITGHENGKVYGNVFEVGEYIKHVERVRDIALPIDTVTLEYSESWGVNCGLTITVPRKEYDDDRHRLMCDSGNVISVKMNPFEKDITMADIMKTEQAHRMAMPKGNTQVYLQKLEEKLFAIRGEPLEHMIQLVPKNPKEPVATSAPNPNKPTAPTLPAAPDKKPVPNNPQGFEAFLKEAQAKADKFNAENAQNKVQQPTNTKTNPEIGD